MKKLLKLSISFLVVTAVLLSAGLTVYSAANGQNDSELNQSVINEQGTLFSQELGTNTVVAEDKVSITISNATKEFIRLSDSKNYEKNIANYTELLISLNVHEKYIDEIERLLKENYKISDILTAYSFLNDKFGMIQEVEELVQEKESGKAWADIFEAYNKKNPEFVPGSFEQGYVEEVMNTPGMTADDIMLADRVSQKTGKTMPEIMEKRMTGETWKDINAWLDVINGDEAILRVTVTPEQIDKYVNSGMKRDVVVQGYVVAEKLSQNADTVIKQLKVGTKVEELLDKYYTQKYY